MVNPRLLRSVLFGVWAVDDSLKSSTLPLLGKMLKGEQFELYAERESNYKPFTVTLARHSHWDGFANARKDSIAVIPVKGVITKEDQACGPDGTISLMRKLAQADSNDNILSIIIDADSGGGEGTNIMSVASFIRNEIKKPVYVWYSGLNASAMYGISAGADEIFAAQSTDIVGSIGVFTTVANWKKYYASQGLELTDVYSKFSSEKNSWWKQAVEGNTKPLQENLLDPFARAFHASVTEMRPNLDESVLKGGVYMSEQAIEKGLIDGVKSWTEMLDYAEAKGFAHRKAQSNNSKNNIQMNKNFGKIAAFFGFNSLETDQDGNASLNTEALEKLEAHLEANGKLEATITANVEAAMDKKLTAKLTTKFEAMDKKLTAIETKVDAVGDLAPAPKPVAGEEPSGDNNELSPYEQQVQAEFEGK